MSLSASVVFPKSRPTLEDYKEVPFHMGGESGRVYVADGFEYIKNRIKGDNMYLLCRKMMRKERSEKCQGKAKYLIKTKQFFITNPDHICQYDEDAL